MVAARQDQRKARWWVVGSVVVVLADVLSLLIGPTTPGAMLAFALDCHDVGDR